jgi:hypothetical protein
MASRRQPKAEQAKRKPPVFVPDPRDARHVRRAFELDARHPERRITVSPDELRRWAETGAWPESSD